MQNTTCSGVQYTSFKIVRNDGGFRVYGSLLQPPDRWRQVAYTGTKLLYQPEPKPVVYIVPTKNILGRLALAPYGEHWTIPYDWRHLQGSHYPRGVCDLPNRQGSGSKLFYINSWAMIWSSDHPRVATKP
jgi:hypothetical protein